MIGQIHAINADNASSNDTQSASLARRNNSYEEHNHVCCFNHTVQLSAKTLLAPFNPALSSSAPLADAEDNNTDLDELPELIDGVSDDEDEEEACGSDSADEDDEDENNDFTELTDEEREEVLTKTAAVRETVTKV